MKSLFSTFLLLCGFVSNAFAQDLQVVQIYSDDELIKLLNANTHLDRVVADRCQLIQDIEARAVKAEKPAWQFLWGDMLAFGVCVDKNVELGVHYMRLAADQGLPPALEQLGRYYHVGKFMQVDVRRAIVYLREASALGNLKAQIRLGEIFLSGQGSPLDYPELYHQLHHSIIDNQQTHKKVANILAGLEKLLPHHVVEQAKLPG